MIDECAVRLLQKTTVQACKYQSLDKGKANSCTLFHSNIQPLMVELWSKIACTLILNNLFCLSCFNALKWAFYNHFCLIWHIEALDASYLASCCSMTLCIRFNNIISIKNISTNDNEVKVRNTTKRCCSKKGKIRRYHSNLGVSLLSRSDSITPYYQVKMLLHKTYSPQKTPEIISYPSLTAHWTNLGFFYTAGCPSLCSSFGSRKSFYVSPNEQ